MPLCQEIKSERVLSRVEREIVSKTNKIRPPTFKPFCQCVISVLAETVSLHFVSYSSNSYRLNQFIQ
ncbi:unknown protein [Microcystis aeruginosa NIES-843]|uniref:Uncharacterized protein n=1 Tax=Microcystis aeruginosa (strain NIES-843 / IAM M-2473) TaxID=449447 RepID=B0JJV0_MICAN|nr:unknown protein [Microcystis aeruginosa NIES-843]